MRHTYRILVLFFVLSVGAWAQECWLCHRASPPNPLTQIRYTETHNVVHLICAYCQKDMPACSICAGPTKVKPERDGRRICPDCKAIAIETPAAADTLYKNVQRFVEGLTKAKVDRAPPLRLVQADEMDTRFAEGSGRSSKAHAFYSPYNPEQITLLSGHSAYDLGPTLAHEFTHAWQSRHCPQQDRMIKEGFASWVAYKYAQSQGYSGQMTRMLQATDPDYGEGLKRCLDLEKKLGPSGLISWMQKNSKWPK